MKNIVTFFALLSLFGCKALSSIRQEVKKVGKQQVDVCKIQPALNDPFGQKPDGYAMKIPGAFEDLVFDESAQLRPYSYFNPTLKGIARSKSDSGVAFLVDMKWSYFTELPSNAPVKELKPLAYIENSGPVDPKTWHYFVVTESSIVGLGGTRVAGMSIEIGSAIEPIQWGIGANNRNVEQGVSAAFGARIVAANDDVAKVLPRVDRVLINMSLTCATIEEDVPTPAGSKKDKDKEHRSDWDWD